MVFPRFVCTQNLSPNRKDLGWKKECVESQSGDTENDSEHFFRHDDFLEINEQGDRKKIETVE